MGDVLVPEVLRSRRFTGQLLVLRPDDPILYRYNRAMHDVTRYIAFVTVIKSYRLLWIAVALTCIIREVEQR